MISKEFKCKAGGSRVLVMGDHVSVRIEEMKNNGAKVVIEAPRDIQIDRGSIFDRKNIEDRNRALTSVSSLVEDGEYEPCALPLFLHEGEALHIGSDVRLTLNQLLGQSRQVKITLEAPEELSPDLM